ncbi:deoxyribonuclease IV [Pseudalkalibacillus decolorationis]|uniref:deoxyribonuclease IV n=1 Tax=Pseudalkalibacillus decolorationis TaxID=163879 RepID=UPI0021476DCD|nr:deoxyribonuclease IV [Pseudalkalibacillus decolorationis]
MKFGCHVSIREGYFGAAKHALKIGGQAYQYFPKNPRSLTIKEYDREDAKRCKEYCQEHGLDSVAHTPYPTNLTPPAKKKELVITSILNDLEIADACGSVGVVVHFGSQISNTDPLASYHVMIDMLNTVLKQWDGQCKILLENNAGKPGTMGTTLEELVQVRSLIDDPKKVGFCFDTCHAFASGLWIGENETEFWEKGRELGYFQELKIIHLNNSKYPFSSGKDRHANIFTGGFIEEKHIKQFVQSSLLSDVPFILETPSDKGTSHEEELKMLKHKMGTGPNGSER